MTDFTLIGFQPAAGTSLAEARGALDDAARAAGGSPVRHWDGGALARYSVFADLDSAVAFASGVDEVEIVGYADLVAESPSALPDAFDCDFEGVARGDWDAVLLCSCGGFEPNGHEPDCPKAGRSL